jgi:hypothetical protein
VVIGVQSRDSGPHDIVPHQFVSKFGNVSELQELGYKKTDKFNRWLYLNINIYHIEIGALCPHAMGLLAGF